MSGEDWQGGGKRKPAAPDFTPISRNRHPVHPRSHLFPDAGLRRFLGAALFQLPGWNTGDAWDDEDTVSERGRLLLKVTPRAELDSKLWASQ